MENKFSKEEQNKQLILIPKVEDYIEYILIIIMKIPRVEKFSIGTEYKKSLYKMIEKVMYLYKINKKSKDYFEISLKYINEIDAELNVQRIFLRIMNKEQWIDVKKFNIAMNKIYEIGKIVGGLAKYYAQNT